MIKILVVVWILLLLLLGSLALVMDPAPVYPHTPGQAAGAVLVGVVCGVLAGVPASVLILVILTRRSTPPAFVPPSQDYDPVVVIEPGRQFYTVDLIEQEPAGYLEGGEAWG